VAKAHICAFDPKIKYMVQVFKISLTNSRFWVSIWQVYVAQENEHRSITSRLQGCRKCFIQHFPQDAGDPAYAERLMFENTAEDFVSLIG